jgi:cytochrome P450
VDELAAECAAKIATADSWDAMEDLANVIPRCVIGDLLEVEPDRQADLTRWTYEMMAATVGADRNSADARNRLLDVLAEFTNYFVPKIDAKRANPGDDFISDLVRAEGSDGPSSLETLLTIRLLMIAGTDTTAAMIGNTVLALVRRPDQAEILAHEPNLIGNAVEESLRYWAPFYFVLRETLRDVVLEGVEIPAGSLVAMMLSSANQDEAVFPNPGTFDVRRQAGGSGHMAFGHGPHRCVGAFLAREEADAAIRAVLPLLPEFRLSDEPLELAESQLLQGFRKISLVRK